MATDRPKYWMVDAHVHFHWPFHAVQCIFPYLHISIDLMHSSHNSSYLDRTLGRLAFFCIKKLYTLTHFLPEFINRKSQMNTPKKVVNNNNNNNNNSNDSSRSKEKKNIYNNINWRTSIITDRGRKQAWPYIVNSTKCIIALFAKEQSLLLLYYIYIYIRSELFQHFFRIHLELRFLCSFTIWTHNTHTKNLCECVFFSFHAVFCISTNATELN